MSVKEAIKNYIAAQPEQKGSDMQELHKLILKIMPGCKLWFMDGKNEQGKVVSNPNIGYGLQTLKYANGKTKEFYQVGFCANKTGISVYILCLSDRKYLAKTYSKKIGKAGVSSYCITFKTLADIHVDVLKEAIQYSIKKK